MNRILFKLNFPTIDKIALILFITILGYSCIQEDIPIGTFKGDQIYSFLEKDTSYSEYVKIVERVGFKGMLNAYGSYTCLAPNNIALKNYYKSLGVNYTIDSLRLGQLDTLARTHIITAKYMTYDMVNGVLSNVNMNKRFIVVEFDTITGKIILNNSASIISRDNQVYNGVIHGINEVIALSDYELPELMKKNPDISIFSEALKLTGLADSISPIKDLKYAPTKTLLDHWFTFEIINPAERKYGFTAFVENNNVLKNYGINNITDLINKANELYPNGKGYENEYTNRNNSLNQYISYHLVEKSIYLNQFFIRYRMTKGFTPNEFIETMLENHIIRSSLEYGKITLNTETNDEVHVLEQGGKSTVNGVYHLIDKMLVYNSGVENMLTNTRMRVDMSQLFPELTNNNMRASRGVTDFPAGDEYGFEQGYLKYIKMSNDTKLFYIAQKEGTGYTDYQGDAMLAQGIYDITMRLLPVPPGTYELRFGYAANGNRSITQIYVDEKPIGIPLDLKILPSDARIGWIRDDLTEDNGYENDKMIRNRGYMKGPSTSSNYTDGDNIFRNINGPMRRIIGTFTFDDYSPHYLRFKSVIDDDTKQMLLDYFEWVPKSVFNPASGEPESRE